MNRRQPPRKPDAQPVRENKQRAPRHFRAWAPVALFVALAIVAYATGRLLRYW